MKQDREMKKSMRSIVAAPFKAARNVVYDLSAAVSRRFKNGKNAKGFSRRNRRDMIYYIAMMAWPILHFGVFYIGVNVNSILLSFKVYAGSGTAFNWAGFDNFSRVFKECWSSQIIQIALKNSVLIFFIGLLLITPPSFLFAFFIYKKMPMSGIFRVFLFLPSILSSVVMIIIYSFFADRALPEIFSLMNVKIPRLLADQKVNFGTVIFYSIWMGFGSGVLINTSLMNGISVEVSEAARLDGAVGIKEVWHVVLPHCWPMIATSLVCGFAGILGADANLYTFFAEGAETRMWTFGYFMLVKTLTTSVPNYPYLAAFGIVMTLVLAPLTIGLRAILNRVGPSED